MPGMVSAAAIYARISSDPEGDRLGVTRQREDCEALAARKGWPVAEVYIDDDRSAYSGKPRPEYRRMLADVGERRIDAVLVYNLDRLHRQPRELEAFFDVVDGVGLKDLASVEGDINLASHDGRFHARILGAVARKASDDLSRRISRKEQERAMRGLPGHGGPRPFGYTADRLSVEPGEAALVREAASRVLAGDSLRTIATEWNAKGIPTTTGKAWTIPTLRRTLTNPFMSGQREYKGEVVATGVWPPILTVAETARLTAVLDERTRSRTRVVRRYLLTHLLRCGLCGATLISRPTADGTRRYVCAKGLAQSGCGRLAINADGIEPWIEEAVLQRVESNAIVGAWTGAANDDALTVAEQEALARDRNQLDELAAAYGQRLVTLSEWLAARKPIEARIETARKKLSVLSRTAVLDPFIGHGRALREQWSTLPLDRQRSIVAAVMDRAVVRPAVRGRAAFDPARIEPVWREG